MTNQQHPTGPDAHFEAGAPYSSPAPYAAQPSGGAVPGAPTPNSAPAAQGAPPPWGAQGWFDGANLPAKRGVAAWLQFLWLYLPIPGANVLAYVIATVVTFMSARKQGRLAAENSRHALNWALTYAGVLIALFIAGFVAVMAATGGSGSLPSGHPATWPIIAAVVWLFLGGILMLIFCISGAVTANKGRVYRPVLAIPFIPQGSGRPSNTLGYNGQPL